MSDPASHTAGDHDRTGALSQRNVTGKCTKTQTEAVECGAGVGHIGHRDCRRRDTSHCLRACRRYHEPDGGPARSGDLLCDHRILRPLRRTAAAKGRLSSDSRSGSSLGLARTEAVAGDLDADLVCIQEVPLGGSNEITARISTRLGASQSDEARTDAHAPEVCYFYPIYPQ